jgi:murein DD-endopeptidase MepM/ murein hydrolase activator NlpD
LGNLHLVVGILFLSALVISGALGLYYLAVRHAAVLGLPLVEEISLSATQGDAAKREKYLRENLAAMARKLGEMQAQLMRLDALGERVQGLAGVKPEEFNFKEKPGQGGAAPSISGRRERELTMSEFQLALDALSSDIEHRMDYMNVVETALMTDKMKSKLLPTIQPVNVAYNASSYGWRLDPFSGRSAFHEGIDFAAGVGTPIFAAAGGVVIGAEYHHQYGNLLEIDHGNDIITRYAHASRLLAKVGDIVRRGQHVANIGSTGRSTGPHLHFEVHVKGVPQNPMKFLAAGADQAKAVALYGR